MSAERTVPTARSAALMKLVTGVALVVALAGAIALLVGGPEPMHSWEVMSARAPGGARVALVRGTNCEGGPCQTLWIGGSVESATEVASLAPGTERCSEIAWTPDGGRVAFLVNGYQLSIYDAETLIPAGQLRLVEPDGPPPSRIARGVTFSENGLAVTFDDCPRTTSGCRAGLVAVPR